MSMSAAAVQPSTTAAISSHQQYPLEYYQQQRQSSTRASNAPNSGSVTASTPTQAQQQSPGGSSDSKTHSNMTTPRAQASSVVQNASPVVSSTTTATGGPPIPPPPRSSSNQRSPPPSSPASAMDATATATAAVTTAATAPPSTGSLSKRRAPRQSPPKEGVGKSSEAQNHSSSNPATATSGSRSSQPPPPMGSSLPREDSTVINRLVIDDPEEDLSREKARIAESRPLPLPTSTSSSSGGGGGGSDERRTRSAGTGGETTGQTTSRSGKGRGERSERSRKEIKFGEYILGQTLGEGEFGKVKMGWKRDGGAQVAIKLIRRESLGSNPSRLPKIYREISILRGLQHPNIVRLHEMVETERHIGIILEYASGGELFDFILQHRYLKDNSARRLFAQLVSGVGYLHKKGIVHRDLKLENLLLDRNRNIIITDFGFANTFDPNDELGEEVEYNLSNKDFVRKTGLDHVRDDGHRRGDLMQTSCGSPCYAAPELVVSDSLYTGRKVDVWSCGVILYAMLAGYLPFDDDPANPEGDNIVLLYKYIVSTPLTFPEYVTPHARDLLKRILVPDPRKRADLFEIARHSWLSEYAHVVAFITSSTTSPHDIANTTIPSESTGLEAPLLARSASVREPSKPHPPAPTVGGLVQRQGQIDQAHQPDKARGQREAKRRTVQLEYVAPQSSTARGEAVYATSTPTKTRARNGSQGPIEVAATDSYQTRKDGPSQSVPTSAVPSGAMPPPARPLRDQQRAASDAVVVQSVGSGNTTALSSQRPSTGGSIAGVTRLPVRSAANGNNVNNGNSSNYGQPAVAVAREQAHGRISQPKHTQYNISTPIPQDRRAGDRLSYVDSSAYNQHYPENPSQPVESNPSRGHRRSATISGISEKLFGKRGSFFGSRRDDEAEQPSKKGSKSHPPVSMTKPLPNENPEPRQSSESRRTSFSFTRKTSNPGQTAGDCASRRFSFIPSFGKSNQNQADSVDQPNRLSVSKNDSRQRMAFGRGESRSSSRSTTGSTIPVVYDSGLDRPRDPSGRNSHQQRAQYVVQNPADPYAAQPHNYPSQTPQDGEYYTTDGTFLDTPDTPTQLPNAMTQAHLYADAKQQQQQHNVLPGYNPSPEFNYDETDDVYRPSTKQSVLQKGRRFNEAYESESGHAGSSGAARRVMDFFRKRGRARGGE